MYEYYHAQPGCQWHIAMLCYGVKPSFFCRGGSQKGEGGLPKQVNIKTTAYDEVVGIT